MDVLLLWCKPSFSFLLLSFLLVKAFKINCYIIMSFYITLDKLEEIVSNDKLPTKMGIWSTKRSFANPFYRPAVCYVRKESITAIKGKTSVKIKKKCTENKKNALKQSYIYKGSRRHTQPTKKMDCPVKFCIKKIHRFTCYKVNCNTKHNREKVTKLLREDLK